MTAKEIRIGQGVDVHELAQGVPLTVGGVNIPFDRGSLGHSDGDPLLHAIVDALLGAMAKGDIGTHFPSSDSRWKGADSSRFITHVMDLMDFEGYHVVNVDATVILQEPALRPYIPEMKRKIATLLKVTQGSVSVKATTTDHLGFVGKGEGIAAMAVVLITK